MIPARRRAAALVLVLAALVAAGCRGGGRAAGRDAPSTTAPPETTAPVETTTTTVRPATYPLTGRPVTDPATAARAAVAVKIDNIAAARPQAGIAAADIVYEEFTEGVTRFVVVYHSTDAEVVGPVRSVRPADPVIVAPLGGVLGFSGGSPAAVALAREAPLTLVTEGDTAVMYRRPGRRAPHNLYTSTQGLFSRVPAEARAPRTFAWFLPEGAPFSPVGATPVSTIQLRPATYVSAGYDWDPATGTWLRSTDGRPHLLEEGRVAPTTVIVQFAPYVQFAADSAVDYPEVVGAGDAWIFATGSMVQGRWSKADATAVTVFTDAAGTPVALPPGQSWVHLLAPGSAVTTG